MFKIQKNFIKKKLFWARECWDRGVSVICETLEMSLWEQSFSHKIDFTALGFHTDQPPASELKKPYFLRYTFIWTGRNSGILRENHQNLAFIYQNALLIIASIRAWIFL